MEATSKRDGSVTNGADSDNSSQKEGLRVHELRISYDQGVLTEDMLLPNGQAPNPFDQFSDWFSQAVDSSILEPNAMVVSTVDKGGIPSSRTVLLKDFAPSGFSFFTNIESRKGSEIAHNAHVSLLFPWYELHRQVIVSGTAEPIDRDSVAEYFHSRPRGSQLGAWASRQSQTLAGREQIDKQYEDVTNRFDGTDPIPVPDFWGGFLVRATRIEFWQGRDSRLHDRIQFMCVSKSTDLKAAENWRVERLSP